MDFKLQVAWPRILSCSDPQGYKTGTEREKRQTEKGIAGDRQDTQKRGTQAGSGGPHSNILRITTRHRPLAPTVTCARGRVMPAISTL